MCNRNDNNKNTIENMGCESIKMFPELPYLFFYPVFPLSRDPCMYERGQKSVEIVD